MGEEMHQVKDLRLGKDSFCLINPLFTSSEVKHAIAEVQDRAIEYILIALKKTVQYGSGEVMVYVCFSSV